jgi:DNA replication protein DnaC
MPIETTCEQLKQMNLTRMSESLKNRFQTGDHIDLSHEQFIGLLVEDEYIARKQRRLQKMIATAQFKPELPSLEDINYSPPRGFQKKDIMQFSTLQWVENAQNIIFTGPTGCGKSFLAQAIAQQACRMGVAALNVRYNILIEEVNAARGTGMYLKYLKKLAKVKVLIIDDFLMHNVTTMDLSSIMDVIEEKQQVGSVIITTQYPIPQWHKRMPDPTIADAICDRLVHNAYKFHLEGDSMRKIKKNLK